MSAWLRETHILVRRLCTLPPQPPSGTSQRSRSPRLVYAKRRAPSHSAAGKLLRSCSPSRSPMRSWTWDCRQRISMVSTALAISTSWLTLLRSWSHFRFLHRHLLHLPRDSPAHQRRARRDVCGWGQAVEHAQAQDHTRPVGHEATLEANRGHLSLSNVANCILKGPKLITFVCGLGELEVARCAWRTVWTAVTHCFSFFSWPSALHKSSAFAVLPIAVLRLTTRAPRPRARASAWCRLPEGSLDIP